MSDFHRLVHCFSLPSGVQSLTWAWQGKILYPAKVGKNVLSFYICNSLQKVGVDIDVKDKEAVTRMRSFHK